MKQREAELEHVDRGEYNLRERLAGAFIIAAILLLIGALAFSSQVAFLLSDTFTLHARIDSAEGVTEEAVVKYAGVEIGQVTSVELTPERHILLTMKIREKYHDLVRTDSTAKLNRLAILGDVTVEITRGDPDLPLMEDGARIPVKETPTLDVLLSQLAPAVQDVVATADHARNVVEAVDPGAVRKITEDLRAAVADIRALAERVNNGSGTIGRLFTDDQLAQDIAASATELAEALKLAQARLRDLQPLIKKATARTEEMAELMDEATGVIHQLGGAIDSFESGPGGAFSGVLQEARSALDEAEKTLRAIRNTWPFSGNAPEEKPVEAVPPQPPAD